MAHGGKRRRHVPPAMSREEVMFAKQMRAWNVPYKVLEDMLGFQRHVLSNAVRGCMAYKGFK